MRVVVDLCAVEDQGTLLLQHFLDVLVSGLHMLTLEVHNVVREAAVVVHRAHEPGPVLQDNPRAQADSVIVLAKSRGLVHNACARLRGNIAVAHHMPGLLSDDLAFEVVEEGQVGRPDQLGSPDLLEELEVRLGVLLDRRADPLPPVLADDPHHSVLLLLHAQVCERGIHAQCNVGGQSPGRGRPRKQVAVLFVRNLKLNNDGWVGDLLVVLRHLEVGERSATCRAVRHDAEGPIDQPLGVELLEDPPATLHEGQIHGLVVIVKVNPAAEPLHNLTPLLGVSLDNGPALLVVLVDAHLQDIGAPL
mmetsp:Transcript_96819/g.269232  ORF Transcript_96819/g.269232 Transcript_96819/m.269232 type:complete len:305 (+) Transcript_96819:2331-3245(+)